MPWDFRKSPADLGRAKISNWIIRLIVTWSCEHRLKWRLVKIRVSARMQQMLELARGVSSSEVWFLGLNEGRVGSCWFRRFLVSLYLFFLSSLRMPKPTKLVLHFSDGFKTCIGCWWLVCILLLVNASELVFDEMPPQHVWRVALWSRVENKVSDHGSWS